MDYIPDDLVRQRSYEIWLRDGCPHGLAVQHWLEAKNQLDAEFRAARFPHADCDCRKIVLPRPSISRLPHKKLSLRIPSDQRSAAA